MGRQTGRSLIREALDGGRAEVAMRRRQSASAPAGLGMGGGMGMAAGLHNVPMVYCGQWDQRPQSPDPTGLKMKRKRHLEPLRY